MEGFMSKLSCFYTPLEKTGGNAAFTSCWREGTNRLSMLHKSAWMWAQSTLINLIQPFRTLVWWPVLGKGGGGQEMLTGQTRGWATEHNFFSKSWGVMMGLWTRKYFHILFFQVGKRSQKACGGHACIDKPDHNLILIYFLLYTEIKKHHYF